MEVHAFYHSTNIVIPSEGEQEASPVIPSEVEGRGT